MEKRQIFDFLNNALEISLSISIKYKLLKTLEQSNMRNGSIFLDTKRSLINALEKEKKMYEDANITFTDAAKMLALLVREKNISPRINVIEYIIKNKGDFSPELRVFFKIDHILVHSQEFARKNMKKSIPEFLYENISDVELKAQIDQSNVINDAIFYNYHMIFISFIETYLKNNSNDSYYENVLHAKYLFSYLNQIVETSFLEHDFKIPESLYINHQLFADYFKLPNFIFEMMVNAILEERNKAQINKCLLIKNDDIEEKCVEMILRSFLIRSANVMLSDYALNEAKKDFLALLDNGEYVANEIAAEEIKRDYEYIEKDKSRHKYLSFKPNA